MKATQRIFFAGLVSLLSINSGHTQNLGTNETLALLERIAQSRAGSVIQANFREKKFMPIMRDPIIETGIIAYEQPNKLLREVDRGGLIVSDGRTLWMYYPQFQQAEKYSLTGKQGEFFAILPKIFQLQNLSTYFRVEAMRVKNGFRLELIPRTSSVRQAIKHVSIEFDEDLQLRSSSVIGAEGDRIETSYSNEKRLPSGSIDFSFVPPKDVHVVSPLAK